MLRKEQLYKKITDILNVDFKILSRFLDERLGFLVEDNYQFILEEYTDAKWKEILSLAYINTSYIQRQRTFACPRTEKFTFCRRLIF
jgi:hypothetical protein